MFIIINQINTDGDFSYSMKDDVVKYAKDEKEAYFIFVQYMQSIANADFGHREYLSEHIAGYANEWLKENNEEEWYIPNQDFGNQSIDFRMVERNTSEPSENLVKEMNDAINGSVNELKEKFDKLGMKISDVELSYYKMGFVEAYKLLKGVMNAS